MCCGADAKGYETLLNTDIRRELDQLGRFVSLVVEHKHKIGFKGPILIEPKPRSRPSINMISTSPPATASCSATISEGRQAQHRAEPRHPRRPFVPARGRAGQALGVFGSLDINRGDDLLGWDTDQFAMNVPELALVFHEI
jgi:xylose isomerase